MDEQLDRLLKVLNLVSRSRYKCLPYCVEFVEHLTQETDVALKQEVFDYVEQQIDNYQPSIEPTMLMWYEFAQAFSALKADPIIGIRSTRMYDYTYAKWQGDYELVLAKFSHGSHACDYDRYISELKLCGDERSLPIMAIMAAHNDRHRDDYDDNGAGGYPRYTYGYYWGAGDAREAIIQRVDTIDLSGQNLTEIPATIYQLKNLTSLNLSNNKITKISAAIGKLTNLTSFNLSGNKIVEIPMEIGELTRLTSLDLSYNQITEIPAAISKLEYLTKLDLCENKIAEIPDAIGKLKELIHFSLSGNQIFKIPAAIGELKNLNYLCLSDNKITEIPIEIGELKNLTYLILADNKITVIPQWLQSSKNLKTLTVTGRDNGVDLNMDRSGCSFVIILPPEEENMWFR